MAQRRQALVVTATPEISDRVAEWLAAAGYSAVVVREFRAARRELDAAIPDLLVTEVKLGAHNGLHLAILVRSRGWNTPVVIIGVTDPVLQAEAAQHQATYLTTPLEHQSLMDAIQHVQTDYRPARRSPRKRVPMLDALVNDVPARVVDVSYEGLRLEVPDKPESAVPPFFMVKIPLFNVTCRAQRVWSVASAEEKLTWCGAALVGGDPAVALAWRTLVDSVPGWTLLAH
jgi:DNA-binding response OmpR family regulator